jgi:hypothetical protein
MRRNLDTNPTRNVEAPNFEIPFDDLFIFEALILRKLL